jgi:multidrug efflux pump subunit AcrB
MAIVVIGALISLTLLTLVLVPVVYSYPSGEPHLFSLPNDS